MKRRVLLGLAVAASAAAVFALQGGRTLFINGKKSAKPPIVKGSETYIPLSSLKAAGAGVTVERNKISIQFTPPTGRDERPYVEGMIDEYVSNEAFRIKVSNIQPISNPFGTGGNGFSADIEVRNLLDKPETLHGAGLDGPRLIDSASNSLSPTSSSFPGRNQLLEPGGSFTNTLKFGPTQPGMQVRNAEKIIFNFRPFGKPKAYKAIRISLISK